jgi:hypothetical protein
MSLLRLLRPRFTLRALLVVMALLCFWLWRQMEWIAERHRQFETMAVRDRSKQPIAAPRLLSLFGEMGHEKLWVTADAWNAKADRDKLRSLFPESGFRVSPPRISDYLLQAPPDIEAVESIRRKVAKERKLIGSF